MKTIIHFCHVYIKRVINVAGTAVRFLRSSLEVLTLRENRLGDGGVGAISEVHRPW